jgi:hypothetical protein
MIVANQYLCEEQQYEPLYAFDIVAFSKDSAN